MAMSSFGSHTHNPKHLWLKASPLLALSLTIATALCLIILNLRGWRSSENFAQFVIFHRTAVAISVQIISHLLGLLQVTAIGAVIKLSFNRYTVSHPVKLSSLHLTSAIYSCYTAWSLPIGLSSLSAMFVVITLLPAALWSGAMTPLLSNHELHTTIQAPTFLTSNASAMWSVNISTATPGSGGAGQWQNNLGLFSTSPTTVRGLLLNSASSASATNGSGTFHAKLDKTGFVYANRSYGMGSAAGLVQTSVSANPLLLSYLETGFGSNVTCKYNTSTEFGLFKLPNPNNWFQLYRGQGSYSYKTNESYGGVFVSRVPQDIFAWTSDYSPSLKSIFIPMKTLASSVQDDWRFLDFNAAQCQVQFTMRTFTVGVNYTSKQISVAPVDSVSSEPARWPDYGDEVVTKIASWIKSISNTDSFTDGSQLGRSIRLNVEALRSANHTRPDAVVMQGIAEHVASLVDNTIVALLSARFVVGRQSAPVEARVTVLAIVYGDGRYIIAVLVINILILLLYIFEALRTRLWEGLLEEDLLDISSLVVGIVGGNVKLVDVNDYETVDEGPRGGNIQLVATSATARDGGSKERLMANLA